MIYTTNTQYLLMGNIVGTFKGYKETPGGLVLRFQIPKHQEEQIFSKYEVIKKI
jgi:hypothetical protein